MGAGHATAIAIAFAILSLTRPLIEQAHKLKARRELLHTNNCALMREEKQDKKYIKQLLDEEEYWRTIVSSYSKLINKVFQDLNKQLTNDHHETIPKVLHTFFSMIKAEWNVKNNNNRDSNNRDDDVSNGSAMEVDE